MVCRIFHKNNIGPPNGNRYAPFVEAEWDDGSIPLVLGVDTGDDDVAGNDVATTENAAVENNADQMIGSEQVCALFFFSATAFLKMLIFIIGAHHIHS